MKHFALLLLIATSLCATAQTDGKWRKLKSTEGEFRVVIPGEWEHIHEQFGSKETPTTLHINKHETNPADAAQNVVYKVSWADLNEHIDNEDDNAVQDLFDEQIELAAKARKGGIPVSDVTTSYRGNPGSDIELSYANDEGKIFLRMFLVNNRLYILEVSGMETAISKDDLDRFFESLAIKF